MKNIKTIKVKVPDLKEPIKVIGYNRKSIIIDKDQKGVLGYFDMDNISIHLAIKSLTVGTVAHESTHLALHLCRMFNWEDNIEEMICEIVGSVTDAIMAYDWEKYFEEGSIDE